jgi:hypothetical protein
MSTRLQVVLDESELKEIRRAAGRRRMTVSEWVRTVLREGRRAEPGTAARTKLDVVRSAAEHAFPVSDVEVMLEEIESGYRGPA